MPKIQSKKAPNKLLLILLAVVLAVAIAFAVYFLINKQENADYTNEDTYIGLSENEAIERAEKSGLEYIVVDLDEYPEPRGTTGGTELVLYVSKGKVDSIYLELNPLKD